MLRDAVQEGELESERLGAAVLRSGCRLWEGTACSEAGARRGLCVLGVGGCPTDRNSNRPELRTGRWARSKQGSDRITQGQCGRVKRHRSSRVESPRTSSQQPGHLPSSLFESSSSRGSPP